MSVLGTVEIGGTKTDMSVGTRPEDLAEPVRIQTTDPETTLGAVIDFFSSREVAAVGVAAFGPLDLAPASPRFGRLLATPKPGWSGTDVLGTLTAGIDAPVHLDTDVNGAALGEGRWGAARGMSDFAYMTVGTGIGAGIVVDGRPIRGERHPEVGHISVARHERDAYPGNCPYHGDCLEGMAAGPALEARFGNPKSWPGNDTIVDLASHYLAQGLLTLSYTVGPERIVLGGGVSTLPWLHSRIGARLETLMAGYPVAPDIDLLVSKPGLGDLSGLAGGLVIAGGSG